MHDTRSGWVQVFERLIFLATLTGLGVVAYAAEHPGVFPTVGEPALEVTVFDVGQGDAIFVETPDGAQMLVDGGPDDSVLAKLGEVMPLADRSIDLVVLTHPHADHVAGLVSVLDRYEVGKILITGVQHPTDVYSAFLLKIKSRNLATEVVRGPQEFAFGGSKVKILYPHESLEGERIEDPNASSIVLKIIEGAHDILLAGDIEAEGEGAMRAAGATLDAEVLKVAHHGSKSSSTREFLEAVKPDYALVSVGENTYGHPHPSVLERLRARGISLFRTDREGDITVRTDGTTLCILAGSRILDCK